MQTLIYELPEVTLVGGDHQIMDFRLVMPSGELYDAGLGGIHCAAEFAVCNYSNKVGTPLFTLRPSFRQNGEGVFCILHVEIPGAQTYQMYGKYIYQIILMDEYGKFEVPKHGILYITRNIDEKTFAAWDEGGFDSDVVVSGNNEWRKEYRDGQVVIVSLANSKITIQWYDDLFKTDMKFNQITMPKSGISPGDQVDVCVVENITQNGQKWAEAVVNTNLKTYFTEDYNYRVWFSFVATDAMFSEGEPKEANLLGVTREDLARTVSELRGY